MRDVRCTRCDKLMFKLNGFITGELEQKCLRCKFLNVFVDTVRSNSLSLSSFATDSSVAM